MQTLTITHAIYTHDEAVIVYEPTEAPQHRVVATLEVAARAPYGDYATHALYIDSTHWDHTAWSRSTNSTDPLTWDQEVWIANMLHRYGIHECVDLIPRAWSMLFGQTITARIHSLTPSEWGLLIEFDPHNPNTEYTAWLAGDVYRLIVVQQDEDGEWFDAGGQPYWENVYTDSPEDETDTAHNYWDEWVQENRWTATTEGDDK